jgi:hypothetical protein
MHVKLIIGMGSRSNVLVNSYRLGATPEAADKSKLSLADVLKNCTEESVTLDDESKAWLNAKRVGIELL